MLVGKGVVDGLRVSGVSVVFASLSRVTARAVCKRVGGSPAMVCGGFFFNFLAVIWQCNESFHGNRLSLSRR